MRASTFIMIMGLPACLALQYRQNNEANETHARVVPGPIYENSVACTTQFPNLHTAAGWEGDFCGSVGRHTFTFACPKGCEYVGSITDPVCITAGTRDACRVPTASTESEVCTQVPFHILSRRTHNNDLGDICSAHGGHKWSWIAPTGCQTTLNMLAPYTYQLNADGTASSKVCRVEKSGVVAATPSITGRWELVGSNTHGATVTMVTGIESTNAWEVTRAEAKEFEVEVETSVSAEVGFPGIATVETEVQASASVTASSEVAETTSGAFSQHETHTITVTCPDVGQRPNGLSSGMEYMYQWVVGNQKFKAKTEHFRCHQVMDGIEQPPQCIPTQCGSPSTNPYCKRSGSATGADPRCLAASQRSLFFEHRSKASKSQSTVEAVPLPTIERSSACPELFPNLETFLGYHGDVCRSVGSVSRSWDCPTGCHWGGSDTAGPYCIGSDRNPCRATGNNKCKPPFPTYADMSAHADHGDICRGGSATSWVAPVGCIASSGRVSPYTIASATDTRPCRIERGATAAVPSPIIKGSWKLVASNTHGANVAIETGIVSLNSEAISKTESHAFQAKMKVSASAEVGGVEVEGSVETKAEARESLARTAETATEQTKTSMVTVNCPEKDGNADWSTNAYSQTMDYVYQWVVGNSDFSAKTEHFRCHQVSTGIESPPECMPTRCGNPITNPYCLKSGCTSR